MNDFVLHWGEMGAKWGVSRTVAQVHALLYLAEEPLDAETIAETLNVARSNVSTSLRELQNWKLVRTVNRIGDRRVHYATLHDVWELFTIVMEQRIEREIVPTMAMLRRCLEEARAERPARPVVTTRLAAMEAFLSELHGWYRDVSVLPPSALRALIKSGTTLTRMVPSKARRSASK